jgi:hypothetical protein
VKIFISHSSSDNLFVEKLAKDLSNTGIDVWLDKWEMKVGDSLIKKISEGLSESDYLIVILSKNSVLSEWVSKELNYSLLEEINNRKIKVLPALMEKCDIPVFLSEKFYADFRNDYMSGFNSLLEAITQSSNDDPVISIKGVDFLTSEDTSSFCMEIVIANDSNKEIWLVGLHLHSLTKSCGAGYGPFMYKVNYQVIMPYLFKEQNEQSDSLGKVFEGDENKYSKKVEGNFDYINSSGSESWEIQMAIPIRFRVYAKDKICLRVVFSKPSLSEKETSGSMGSYYTSHISHQMFDVKLLADDSREITYTLKDRDDFIKFVAGGEDKQRILI